MTDLYRVPDLKSLQTLPTLTARDRAVLERLVLLTPETALATASAILRTHQGDLHDLLFPPGRPGQRPGLGAFAAALVYLALAMAAPAQGKLLPLLAARDVQAARQLAQRRLAEFGTAPPPQADEVAATLIPDPELVQVLEALIARASARPDRDPRWVRAVVYAEASAFYTVLAQVCAEQFRASGDVAQATQRLAWAARVRDLLNEALAPTDEGPRSFDPAKQAARIARLREFGWQEFTASQGRTLREIAAEAAAVGLRAFTGFALSAEWETHGASQPTRGGRYFIRPALLPDSTGLPLWAQEERLAPLQKILAGDPAETGLRLGLGSVELFLEFVVRTGQRDFLVGRWTRTSNRFDGLATRFGLVAPDSYAITLFPGSRADETVGLCPVIEVVQSA